MESVKRRKTPFGGKDGSYPDDMDRDMIPLCDALNSLPGVRTFFCCSGHGKGMEGTFYITMGCGSVKSLRRVVDAFDRRVGPDSDPAKYEIELDTVFWPLRKNEICVRVANRRVDYLDARARKKEFAAVARSLLEDA